MNITYKRLFAGAISVLVTQVHDGFVLDSFGTLSVETLYSSLLFKSHASENFRERLRATRSYS